MTQRPLLTIHLRVCRLHVTYSRLARGHSGTRLAIGSRNWLKPGQYVWRVCVRTVHPQTGREVSCRVWRSAWRRTLPYLGMEPARFAWEYRPRQRRK